MPNKPIIDIDVNSEPFERFKRLFDQYAKDVGAVSAEWQAMAANSNAGLKPLAEYANRAAQAHQRLTVAITRTGHAMSGLVKSGVAFAKTIEHIAGFFTKWGTIGTGLGLFGIDRLANSVLERQRSAVGSGLSVGQQSSFAANMAPVLGSPGSFLGSVANAKQDYSKWWALSAMGINPMAAQNQSTFDLGLQIESRARALWKQNPNLQVAQARGLTEFFSPEDLRNLGGMSDERFAAMQSQTRKDVTGLSFGSKQAEEWTALSVQLHKAGLEIERVLVDGLGGLTPELKDLSKAVVEAIDTFMKSPNVKEALHDLADGIGEFAKYVASPKFKGDVKEFADDVGLLAEKLVSALKLLGVVKDVAPAAVVGGVIGGAIAGPPGAVVGATGGALGAAGAKTQAQTMQDQINQTGGFWDLNTGQWVPAPGLMQKMAYVESSGNPNAVSKKGAVGLMQFMPRTAKMLGIDPRDPKQAMAGAAHYMRYLMARFGGDIEKAEAAYNWGEGHLSRDIARYGSAWKQHLPQETQDYLKKLNGGDQTTDVLRRLLRVTKNQAQRQPASITVHNNTAAHIAVQANSAVSI